MKKSIKLNNKGLSLIELLIALAISSIILTAVALLMSNGVFGYNKQTTMSTLQDDANLAMNHITNAIMEANVISLEQATDGNNTVSFTTHDDSAVAQGIASNKYIFDRDTETLYVADIDGDLASASPLCTRVKSFCVQLTTDSLDISGGKVANIKDVTRFKVTIVLESRDNQRSVTRYTNVRNKLTLDTLKMPLLSDDGNIKNLNVASELVAVGYVAD